MAYNRVINNAMGSLVGGLPVLSDGYTIDGYWLSSDGSSTLGTSPVLVDTPIVADRGGRQYDITIKNLSTSNRLALFPIPFGVTPPAFDANPGIVSGVILAAGETQRFLLPCTADLWVVGSGASTIWSAAIFIK